MEQSRLGITLRTVLLNGVRIILPLWIRLKLKRNDGYPVQENHQVNPFVVTRPNFFSDREDIFPIVLQEFWVKIGGRLAIHQIQVLVCKVNAVLERADKASVLLVHFAVEVVEQGFLEIALVHLAQEFDFFRLRLGQKLHEQFAVYCKTAIEVLVRAHTVAVMLFQVIEDSALVIVTFIDRELHSVFPLNKSSIVISCCATLLLAPSATP